MLRLHTFGGCFLDRDGVRLDAFSGQRKGLALLAMVAGSRHGVTREALLAVFWPESDEERARTSLRQLVHAMRTQLGTPDLLLPAADLRLNPDVIASDVGDFRAAIDGGDPAAAVACYAGPFLDGFFLKGADGFERWASAERAMLAHDAARALESLAGRAAEAGDLRASADWWRRLAQLDPLSARGAIGLMRALDAAGDRGAALRHARVFDALVRDEVGADPDPSVAALAEQLRRLPPPTRDGGRGAAAPSVVSEPLAAAESPPAARRPRRWLVPLAAVALMVMWLGVRGGSPPTTGIAASPPTLPGRATVPPASVAVLVFANTSGDAHDEHLSDGLTDELIAALGKVPGLKVTGRTSSFALRGRALSVRAIADTLGVATVLEGSWRRVGRRLRVSAQLVSARDGAVLWSESYDRELANVIGLQEDIARAIVGALRARLVEPGPPTLAFGAGTSDPAAYELYLQGRYIFWARPGRDGTLRAIEYFEQAIARDPKYARAYSGASDGYLRLANFGYAAPQELFAKSKVAARRALALDSTLGEAHASLAHAVLLSDFAWADAEREFRRAIALDPGYAFTRGPFAICLSSQGRIAEALAQLDTAHVIDPLAIWVGNLRGRLLLAAGRPDDAIRVLLQVLALNPEMELAYQQLGHAYLRKGMAAEGIAALRRSAAMSGPRDSAQLAYAYAVTGQRTAARSILRTLLDPSRSGGALPFHIAMAYAGLGEPDSAFAWLERGYATKASFMVGVKVETAFVPLHGDPRWAPLLRRMGLTP
jgi:serine/threonine-protein kinase